MDYGVDTVIRLATKNDCQQVYKWRNDPEVVKYSTSGQGVTWAEHKSWFDYAIRQTDTLLFIIDKEFNIKNEGNKFQLEKNCGQVRLDRQDDYAIITISITKKHRAKGIGLAAVRNASEQAFSKWDIKKIIAYVRDSNESSIKLFEKAGFYQCESKECPEGHREYEMI